MRTILPICPECGEEMVFDVCECQEENKCMPDTSDFRPFVPKDIGPKISEVSSDHDIKNFRGSKPVAYPFAVLRVGDSFHVGYNKSWWKTRKNMQTEIIRIAKRDYPDRRHATRWSVEDGIEGYRVWRVENAKD